MKKKTVLTVLFSVFLLFAVSITQLVMPSVVLGLDNSSGLDMHVNNERAPYQGLWLAGDAHMHTNFSDGGPDTIADRAQEARENGLDFIVITDHDYYFHSRAELDAYYDAVKSVDSAYPDVNVIWGLEWTTSSQDILAYDITPDDFEPYIDTWITPQEAITAIHNAGGVAYMAHPWFPNGTAYDELAGMQNMTGFEGQNGRKPFFTEVGAEWDQLLMAGKRYFVIGNNDAHDGVEAGAMVATFVYCPDSTKEGIIEGYKRGCIYYSDSTRFGSDSRPVFRMEFTVNGTWMGQTLTVPAESTARLWINVSIVEGASTINKVTVIHDGKAERYIPGEGSTNVTQYLDLSAHASSSHSYFRIVVSDTSGRHAVSNPVFLNRIHIERSHLLWDDSHNQYYYSGRFNMLISDLESPFGIVVKTSSTGLNANLLANHSVLVVANPLIPLSPDEIFDVAEFVQGGGALILLGDVQQGGNTRGQPENLNAILEGVGVADKVRFWGTNDRGDEIYDNVSKVLFNWQVVVNGEYFKPHIISEGIDQVTINSASLNVTDLDAIVATTPPTSYTKDVNNVSQRSGRIPWLAALEVGEGKVVICGSSKMFSDREINGTGQAYITYEDNERLFLNFLRWLQLRVFTVTLGGEIYCVTTFSNSIVSSFNYNQSLSEISFNVTGPSGTIGSCSLTISKELLNETFAVLVDNVPIGHIQTENATHYFLYFNYTYGTHKIKIIGGVLTHPSTKTICEMKLDLNTSFNLGAKLKIGFYSYAGEFQAESLVWNGTTPVYIELSIQVLHPQGIPIEIATLVLTHENGSIISTVTTFAMCRSCLRSRAMAICLAWHDASTSERPTMFHELVTIGMQRPYAPT